MNTAILSTNLQDTAKSPEVPDVQKHVYTNEMLNSTFGNGIKYYNTGHRTR